MVISYKGKSIVLLSDTHGKHRNLPRFDADIIIHTGDACTDGNIDELDDFFDWFQSCNATYKIFVAGNTTIESSIWNLKDILDKAKITF